MRRKKVTAFLSAAVGENRRIPIVKPKSNHISSHKIFKTYSNDLKFSQQLENDKGKHFCEFHENLTS